MKFEKYHGLGNDFIIVDWKDLPNNINVSQLAIKLCNRFTGIGADGLVIAGSQQHQYQMTFYDPSGYRDQMCGNAIRCLTLYYVNHGFSKDQIEIQTDDGLKVIKIISYQPFIVEVNMQSFIWDPKLIPYITNLEKIHNQKLTLKNQQVIEYSTIKFGPAHVVSFINDLNETKLLEIVDHLNQPHILPESACFNFAKVIDQNNLELKTWERGIGFTLACGTGSCATVAIGLLNKLVKNEVNVHQKLGFLTIEQRQNDYYMKGPATFVFAGEIDIE